MSIDIFNTEFKESLQNEGVTEQLTQAGLSYSQLLEDIGVT